MEESPTKPVKPPKVAKVKNKAPAEIQITAEQLLREAKERDLEIVPPPPKQKISDPDELAEYQHRKRKAFEDALRRNRSVIGNWIKYAKWEESQREVQRARSIYERALDVDHRYYFYSSSSQNKSSKIQRVRSIYERALDVDHRNPTLWLKYTEMEMRAKQINHARNLWDRAVTLLPRVDSLWYKYTYMEEMLGNVAGCRQVFERWMEWEPAEQAWLTYIKFELRYKESDRARAIYERFVYVHPDVSNWIKYARFEEQHGYITSARQVYERAVEFFGDDYLYEKLFISFAKFEEGQKEHERARVIYKYALDRIPSETAQELYKAYTIHEKKFGDRSAIEDVIVNKRKIQYEQEVKSNPLNYDAWFDYLRLLEDGGDEEVIRDTYERAISNVPPVQEKMYWRRYIYFWINYALYEELETQDMERARQVYKTCLEIIPHKKFTFAKMWLFAAQLEIRLKELTSARKLLGRAIGMCPKEKLFRGYIQLERDLGEFDRCRILFEKYLEFSPENCKAWVQYAELEMLLSEDDRVRAIYELAIKQPRLDMPEVVWKAYIDFETGEERYDKTRELCERLLERTQHVKVWRSYAMFELAVATSGEEAERPDSLKEGVATARSIYAKANKSLREAQMAIPEINEEAIAMKKEERLNLLEVWAEFEQEYGDEETVDKVERLMPEKVKKRRKIQTEDGVDAGWEEYFDFIFPEDESAKPNLKLLQLARMWTETGGTESESSDEEES